MAAKHVYLEIAEHPQVILDLMQDIKSNIEKAQKRRTWGCSLATLILISLFMLLVLDLITQPAINLSIIFGLGAFILGAVSLTQNVYFPENQFDAAYKIFHALRDDTGIKGQVQGSLDLSGANTLNKRVRTARSSGGKTKAYYRDMWFQMKFKLADGNVLRVQLFDKVKTKSGAEVRRNTLFRAKLIANPQLYQVRPHSPSFRGGGRIPHISGNTISIEAQVNSKEIPIGGLLKDIKGLYKHLVVHKDSSKARHSSKRIRPDYAQMNRCPRCGGPIEAGTSKCAYCGRSLGEGRI